MSWVATAIVGGAVISGVAGASASKSASNAQQQAADAATAEQRRQYDLTRADYAPWRDVGVTALNRLSVASAGDTSAFSASPDYQFRRTEGTRDLGNSFAAAGGSTGGNALKALAEFNSNLASGEYSNWWNRQAGLAGVGQSATDSTAQAGANSANQISNNYLASGDARASGIMGSANSLTSSANSALNNWLLYKGGYFGNNNQSAVK